MKKFLLQILSILVVVVSPLAATSYPSLDIEYQVEKGEEILLNKDKLNNFIEQWQDNSFITFSEAQANLRKALIEKNLDLEQMQSLYRIQQQQMLFQQREQDFKIGVSSQPLYSLSRSLNQSTTGGYDLSNTFAVGATLSKNLSTGGLASLSASYSSSLTNNSNSSSDWTWSQSPSANITINQPLWIGDGLIDPNYYKKQIEKTEISSKNAKISYDQLLDALVNQGNNQLSTLQTLKESRFILGEQLLIESTALKDAKKDLEEGRISRNAYESRVLNINQIQYSLTEVERQIEAIEDSLKILWNNYDYPDQIIIDKDLFESVPSIIFDKPQLVKTLLENDYLYAQAIGNLRSAEIDAMLKNPSDAPMLSLSFQVSPYYSADSGSSFFSSFEQLFSDGSPLFSLSIGFSASDFSRSSTKLSSSLAQESVLQAKIEVEKVRDDIEQQVETIQRNVKSLLLNLSIAQYDFEQRTNDIEVEQIRFEIGMANENSIKAKQIAWYDSAFLILQNLRELNLIALDLQSRGVDI